MGNYNSNNFKYVNYTTPSKPFDIIFNQACAQALVASTYFTGMLDSVNVKTLSIESGPKSAKGVAIEILERDGITPVVINSFSLTQAPRVEGAVGKLNYAAHYIQTSERVTPGSANATVDFVIIYR